MKLPIVIILTILIVLFISALATFIYYLIYRKAINKRIESGLGSNAKKRKFLNPLSFFIIVAVVLSFLSFGFLAFTSINPSETRLPVFERYDNDSTVILFDPDTDIPGYERTLVNDTDSFKIVVYERKESASSFPYYLIYLDSDSDFEIAYSCQNDKFITDGAMLPSESGWYSVTRNRFKGEVEFYLKNANDDVSFTIELR